MHLIRLIRVLALLRLSMNERLRACVLFRRITGNVLSKSFSGRFIRGAVIL